MVEVMENIIPLEFLHYYLQHISEYVCVLHQLFEAYAYEVNFRLALVVVMVRPC